MSINYASIIGKLRGAVGHIRLSPKARHEVNSLPSRLALAEAVQPTEPSDWGAGRANHCRSTAEEERENTHTSPRANERFDFDDSNKERIDSMAGRHIDVAVIRLDRLRAVAGLLALEEVANAFAEMETAEQVAIFGLFEEISDDARSVLMRA